MNIPDRKYRHSGRVETTVRANQSELAIRALETGLKPLKYQIVSRHHAVKPLSGKGCVSSLYRMMKRCNAVSAVSFSPESWFPVLRTQGVNGAGIFTSVLHERTRSLVVYRSDPADSFSGKNRIPETHNYKISYFPISSVTITGSGGR